MHSLPYSKLHLFITSNCFHFQCYSNPEFSKQFEWRDHYFKTRDVEFHRNQDTTSFSMTGKTRDLTIRFSGEKAKSLMGLKPLLLHLLYPTAKAVGNSYLTLIFLDLIGIFFLWYCLNGSNCIFNQAKYSERLTRWSLRQH